MVLATEFRPGCKGVWMSATVDKQMPLSVVWVNKLLPGLPLVYSGRENNSLKHKRIIPFFLLN